MSSLTPKPARRIWAWWTLVAVSSILLLVLLALNLHGWNRTRALRIELASAESREEARQLARSATEFVNERLDDMYLLGTLLHRLDPSRRSGAFKRDARGMIQHEASFILVGYMDESGLFAASVPKKGVGLRDESGTVRIPDEASGAANVLQSGTPWTSGLFFFKQRLPALAVACPIFNDTGDQCQGAVIGIIDVGLAMRQVLESRLSGSLDARLFLQDIEVASSSSEPERAIFWAQPVRATMRDQLDNSWTVASWPKESHPLMRLEYDSIFRLGVNLFYSMLLWMLLVYMLFSIRRLRLSRRRLRDSEERYTLAVSAGKVGVWDARIETGQFYADVLAQMLGFSAGELGTDLKTWLALVPADDRKRVLVTVQKHLDGITPRYECEHRMSRKDGTVAWLVCVGSVVQRREGRPVRLVGTSTDITDLKQTEEALRRSDERYALAAQSGRTGVWEYILATDTLSTDVNMKAIFGYDEAELTDRPGGWQRLVHADDHERVRNVIIEHIKGRTLRYECTHRIVCKNGATRWVLSSGSAVRDKSGRVVRVVGAATDITERREAQEALRRSEMRYAMATRAGRVGVWEFFIDSNTIETDENMKALLGYGPGELLDDVATLSKMCQPEELPEFMMKLQEHIEGRTPRFEFEGHARCKDNSLRSFMATGFVIRDESGRPMRVIGTTTDITERKAAEEARRRESERAQRYLDIAGVIIVALDTQQRITLINRKGCDVLGYPEQELLGANWIDLCLPERLRPAFREIFEHVIKGRVNTSEFIENPVLTRTGEERLIAWHNILLRDDSGAVTGLLSSGEDVTERRHAQEEAKQREQQLIQADKMASLGVLVSGVAHEINNPNAFILTNTGVLEAAWKSIIPILDRFYEEQGDFLLAGLKYSKMRSRIPVLLAGIRDGARRIKLTVEELRGYAQHEPPGLIEPVNINDVVRSASTLLGNMIRKSTNRFTIQGAEDLPTVQGSFRRLEQVVINLIQNACQALTRADQAITVSTAYDAVALRVLLTVCDEGTGMSEDVISRIKDPFFTTKRESGGTGLGLSISEKIVRDHGGSLSFWSEPGCGTRATISLPVFAEVATIGEEQL